MRTGPKGIHMKIEIEKNPIKAVQFELDCLRCTGCWFDFKEFDMEYKEISIGNC
jgi:hypothetical protein